MKSIKVLGTGCPKCKRTYAIVEKAVEDSGRGVHIEQVDDIMEIMKYDVMSTPAVVIDEEVKIRGRVPSEAELMELLRS